MLVAIAILLGCGGAEEAPSASTATDESQRPSESEMVASMEAHYTSAIEAHDALAQGDLETFRARLTEFDGHGLPPGSPAAWRPFDERLHVAARAGSAANDLETAASAMAMVALACGACHGSVEGGPVYPVPPFGEGDGNISAAMRGHEWAVLMLWDGVTGPSGYAWDRGAEALAVTRIFEGDSAEESLRARVASLRALGEEARTTSAPVRRAELYGRMLATCGDCHQAVGAKLPPYKGRPSS